MSACAGFDMPIRSNKLRTDPALVITLHFPIKNALGTKAPEFNKESLHFTPNCGFRAFKIRPSKGDPRLKDYKLFRSRASPHSHAEIGGLDCNWPIGPFRSVPIVEKFFT